MVATPDETKTMRSVCVCLVTAMACTPRFADTAAPLTDDTATEPTEPTTSTGSSPVAGPCADWGFQALTGKWTGDLWQALALAVQPQTCFDYSAATSHMFLTLDKRDNAVTCVYTGRSTPVYDTKPDPTDMNTEHTWPQSEGADVEPAKCDLHHLFPTDAEANATRGSLPFGEATSGVSWEEGGSSIGQSVDGVTVFEPRDDHKGNVARAMLYFSARYSYPLEPSEITLYRSWDGMDPVDQVELDRSLGIADFQALPNPLVVCPELVSQL